jgi:ankyrin repeat protein
MAKGKPRKPKPPEVSAFVDVLREGDVQAARKMLELGADPNARDAGLRPVIFFAAGATRGDPVATLEALIEAGADARARMYPGETTLTWAVQHGEVGALRVLVEAGAEPGARNNKGLPPLVLAVEHYDNPRERVAALIELGAPVNDADDNEGLTPLMHAAKRGEHALVSALLAAGADATLRDPSGKTATDYAREHGFERPLALLEAASGGIVKGARHGPLPEGLPDPRLARVADLLPRFGSRPLSDKARAALGQGGELERATATALETGETAPLLEMLRRLGWEHGELAEAAAEYVTATLGVGAIEGGAFELYGFGEAVRTLGTWREVTGLEIFGDHPFPGLRIGTDGEGRDFWLFLPRVEWGERNGYVVAMEQGALHEAAEQGAQDGHYYVYPELSESGIPEYHEIFKNNAVVIDVVDLLWLNAALAPGHKGAAWDAVRAVFRWDEERLERALSEKRGDFLRRWQP